jgi:hypothetical protein
MSVPIGNAGRWRVRRPERLMCPRTVRNAAYSASMIWLATCASASGAGNGLLACPSALPGLESIAQLCRQAVRDRRGHDALVRRQQTRRLRRVPRRLGLHVRSGGIRRADAEREGLSTGGDTSDPEPLPGMSTWQLRPHPVRCKRVHPAWSKGATIRSASALATNVHRVSHAALGFGRPQRCWRSLRMRARSRRWAASTSG